MATTSFNIEGLIIDSKVNFIKEVQHAIQREMESQTEDAYTLKIRVVKEDGTNKFTIEKDENQSSQKRFHFQMDGCDQPQKRLRERK